MVLLVNMVKTGLKRMWAHKSICLFFYTLNLAPALLLMLAFRKAISNFAGKSLMGAEIARGIDMDLVIELLTYKTEALPSLITFLALAGAYGLAILFLSAGALYLFSTGGQYSAALFWGNAARYFGRFFRLFFWSTPFLLLLQLFPLIVNLVVRIFFGKDPYENIAYWSFWIKTVLSYFCFLLYMLIFDYARIYTVATDERTMPAALVFSLIFNLKNFWRTMGLAILFVLLGIVVLALYNPLANIFKAPGTIIILLLFLLQQLYMILRAMIRVARYAGEVELYDKIRAMSRN